MPKAEPSLFRDLPPICFAPLPLVMTDEEVAQLLRTEVKTLRSHHRVWSVKHMFPHPLPGMKPLRWSGLQLAAWLHPRKYDEGEVRQLEMIRGLDGLIERYVAEAA